jgi:hypothetical protein
VGEAPTPRETEKTTTGPEYSPESRPAAKPTIMLVIDLVTSAWHLSRTLMAAPFRLLQAARERPA